MKKLIRIGLLLAALSALGWLPFQGTDVAELIPVQTIIVTRSGAEYRVDIGEGVRAVGRTVRDAFRALREEAAGTVFFDTAEQVVVTEAAAEAVEEITELPELRPAAGLWLTPAEDLDVKAVAAYLLAHDTDTTIMEVRAALLTGEAPAIPVLTPTDGGFRVDA